MSVDVLSKLLACRHPQSQVASVSEYGATLAVCHKCGARSMTAMPAERDWRRPLIVEAARRERGAK